MTPLPLPLPLSRRDRAAMVLALEVLRLHASCDADTAVTNACVALAIVGADDGGALAELYEAIAYVVGGIHWRDHDVRDPMYRLLRARLALLLRAVLRADMEDFGPIEWVGCKCWCDGDRGGYQPRRITPLWEQCPRSAP